MLISYCYYNQFSQTLLLKTIHVCQTVLYTRDVQHRSHMTNSKVGELAGLHFFNGPWGTTILGFWSRPPSHHITQTPTFVVRLPSVTFLSPFFPQKDLIGYTGPIQIHSNPFAACIIFLLLHFYKPTGLSEHIFIPL